LGGAGFEKMERGSLAAKYTDRTNPMDKHMEHMMSVREYEVAPPAPQMFGNAGREHMEKYGGAPGWPYFECRCWQRVSGVTGTKREHFVKIAYKNHKHSTKNPYSQVGGAGTPLDF
jgi:acetyl-CoA acetyltransferase